MSYSEKIPLELISELVALLDARMKGYTVDAQLFIIQYSYFEKINNKWILKNFLDIGNEIVKYIYLDVTDDEATNFFVYGQNPKFGTLHIHEKLDMRNKSNSDIIYACDLYIDFEPEHYVGRCHTATPKIE